MAPKNPYSSKTSTAGDAAVGGLFHGLVAGLVMAAYIALAGLLQGIGPLMIWTRLGGALDSPLSGLLAHLAGRGVYGVVGGLLLRPPPGLGPALPARAAGRGHGRVVPPETDQPERAEAGQFPERDQEQQLSLLHISEPPRPY